VKSSGIVTLLSDFGLSDPFVGVMKGVVLHWFPAAKLVDLTHDIGAQDVAVAAFWLARATPWFTPGSVHLAVVDPGVGSARAPIVVHADGHYFVGPDNGLFDAVRRAATSSEVRRIDTAALGLGVPSRTFHGRDIFAPVAGLLAAGDLSFEAVGPEFAPEATLAWPVPTRSDSRWQGEVLAVDRFGNLICNIEPESALSASARAEVRGAAIRCGSTYAEVAPGELVAYVGSFGQLEIAVRNGSAAQQLGASRGTPVTLEGP
jgi:S-adenosyl-L-methionine hydrolase (adenosine-forming)